MTCPHCGRPAGFIECEAEHIERHGLDCGPYEQTYQHWFVCNVCEAEIDARELERHPSRQAKQNAPKM